MTVIEDMRSMDFDKYVGEQLIEAFVMAMVYSADVETNGNNNFERSACQS